MIDRWADITRRALKFTRGKEEPHSTLLYSARAECSGARRAESPGGFYLQNIIYMEQRICCCCSKLERASRINIFAQILYSVSRPRLKRVTRCLRKEDVTPPTPAFPRQIKLSLFTMALFSHDVFRTSLERETNLIFAPRADPRRSPRTPPPSPPTDLETRGFAFIGTIFGAGKFHNFANVRGIKSRP